MPTVESDVYRTNVERTKVERLDETSEERCRWFGDVPDWWVAVGGVQERANRRKGKNNKYAGGKVSRDKDIE